MQYRQVYALLQERASTVRGFRYTDHSGWRNINQDYISHIRPLWIIAEDPLCGRRIWITHECSAIRITVGEMDENGHNGKTLQRISCRTKTELADRLRQLFSQETAVG